MRNYFIYFFITLVFLISCDRPQLVSQYREVIIEPDIDAPFLDGQDPHAFMKTKADMKQLAQDNPQMQALLDQSTAKVSLRWVVPEGWVEEAGSGMRQATFRSSNPNEKDLEVSIISLSGAAGGIEANIIRWLGQINIPAPAKEDLQQFLDAQEEMLTTSKLKIKLLDLTYFQKNEASDVPSAIGAILETADKVVFVKMTGSKQTVQKSLNKFKILCQSLAL